MAKVTMYRMFANMFRRLKTPIMFHEYESPTNARHDAVIKYRVTDADHHTYIITCRLTAINVEPEVKDA